MNKLWYIEIDEDHDKYNAIDEVRR